MIDRIIFIFHNSFIVVITLKKIFWFLKGAIYIYKYMYKFL